MHAAPGRTVAVVYAVRSQLTRTVLGGFCQGEAEPIAIVIDERGVARACAPSGEPFDLEAVWSRCPALRARLMTPFSE